jgi:hypothetical protein
LDLGARVRLFLISTELGLGFVKKPLLLLLAMLAMKSPSPDLLVDRPIPLIDLLGSTTSSTNGESGTKEQTVMYCEVDLGV